MRPQTLTQALKGIGGPFRVKRATWSGMWLLEQPGLKLPVLAHGPLPLIAKALKDRQL